MAIGASARSGMREWVVSISPLMRSRSGTGGNTPAGATRGRHVASLYGEDPTRRMVTTPMAATFDVTDGEIVRARLFYDAADLRRQLIPTDAEPEAVWDTARPRRHLINEHGRSEPDVERNEQTGHDHNRTPAVAPTRSLGGSPSEVSREP